MSEVISSLERDEHEFEKQVFLKFWKDLCTAYAVSVRARRETFLLGTGNLYDALTRAKYFQLEQRYPFDKKELKQSQRKLTGHIATQCLKQLKKDLLVDWGVKPGAKFLVLIDPALVPSAWMTELPPPHRLAGCLQFNLRLTVCIPEELPFGPVEKIPDPVQAPAPTHFDLQVAEDAEIEKRGGTKPKRSKPGKLIAVDHGRKKAN